MGEILASGIARAGLVPAGSIYLTDIDASRVQDLVEQHGFASRPSNREAVEAARIVVLAVKPQDIGQVLEEISPGVGSEHLIVSIAAGITTSFIDDRLASGPAVVRAMPNAASSVGEGITAICAGAHAGDEHLELAEWLLSGVGKVLRVAEPYIDAVTAVSGSGPAYFALFAEAMVDAGVNVGLSRAVASELVIQTMAGTAAMMSRGGLRPAEVREAVTSPAGTTSMALAELERSGVRAAILDAVQAAYDRSKAMAGAPRGKA
jgi:pyrroline-5-carboxylate reductase